MRRTILVALAVSSSVFLGARPAEAQASFIRSIHCSAPGFGDGEFWPAGITVDSSGNVWVTDLGKGLIQQYSPAGDILQTFGGTGSGTGQVMYPHGIAVDRTGNVWVADYGNSRVQEFTGSGTFLRAFDAPAGDNGPFKPFGMAADAVGNVWVTDINNSRVIQFSSSGGFLRSIGGTAGVIDGHFVQPRGVALDSSGNVCVVDCGGERYQEFTSDGEWVKSVITFKDGIVFSGSNIAVDPLGNVFLFHIDDYSTEPMLAEYDSSGNFIKDYMKEGAWSWYITMPNGIAMDSSGNIWVADSSGNRIVEFSVPEPGTVSLLALGGLALLRRKKDRHRGMGAGQ